MTTEADILRTMLVLLATGHAKDCYARAADPKPKPRLRGNQGGAHVRIGSPDARHFSIIGAHLEACRRADAPLNVEFASRNLLDMAAASPIDMNGVKMRFLQNPQQDNLETWNDNAATQQQILAVVRKALQYAGEKVSPEPVPASAPWSDPAPIPSPPVSPTQTPPPSRGMSTCSPPRSPTPRHPAPRRAQGSQNAQSSLL